MSSLHWHGKLPELRRLGEPIREAVPALQRQWPVHPVQGRRRRAEMICRPELVA